jgi:hypothetical protein
MLYTGKNRICDRRAALIPNENLQDPARSRKLIARDSKAVRRGPYVAKTSRNGIEIVCGIRVFATKN